MSYTKKIEFNALAVATMAMDYPYLNAVYQTTGHFNPLTPADVYNIKTNNFNHNAKEVLRKILRSEIEGKALEKEYLDHVERIKLEQEADSKVKFDINISGGGTKKEIIEELYSIIEDLKLKTPEDLLEGVQWESPTLMTTTTDYDDSHERDV